jgi:hypothetical protein
MSPAPIPNYEDDRMRLFTNLNFTPITIMQGGRVIAACLHGEESPGSTKGRWRITSAEGNLRESATENIPPSNG